MTMLPDTAAQAPPDPDAEIKAAMGGASPSVDAEIHTAVAQNHPSIPEAASSRLKATGMGVANAGLNLLEGFYKPSMWASQVADKAEHKLGLLSDKDLADRIQTRKTFQGMMDEDATKVFGGHFIQDVGQQGTLAPLTEALGAPWAIAKGTMMAAPEALPWLSRVGKAMGSATMAGARAGYLQGMTSVPEQGQDLGTLASQSSNASLTGAGVGGLVSAGTAGVTAAVMPVVRGVANVIKGWVQDVPGMFKSVTGSELPAPVSKAITDNAPQTPQNPRSVLPDLDQRMSSAHGEAFQADMAKQQVADRIRANAPFVQLRGLLGDSVYPRDFLAKIDELAQEVRQPGYNAATKQNELDWLYSVRDGIAPPVNGVRPLPNDAPPVPISAAMDAHLGLNASLRAAQFGKGPDAFSNNSARFMMQMKDSLNNVIDSVGAGVGPEFQAAKKNYADIMGPWQDADQGAKWLKAFVQRPDPAKATEAMMLAGPERWNALLGRLSPQGRAAATGGYLQGVLQRSLDPVSLNIDPARALTVINNTEGVFNQLTMPGPDKLKFEGFKNLMHYAYNTGSLGGLLGKLGTIPSDQFAKLYMTPTMTDFLLGAGKMNPTSTLFGDYVTKAMPQVLGGIVGGKASAPRSPYLDAGGPPQ